MTTNIEDSPGHPEEDADDLRESSERGKATPRRSKVGQLEAQDELEQR